MNPGVFVPGMLASIGGAGAMAVVGIKSSNAASAAARAAGLEGAALVRASTKSLPWLIGAAAVAGAGLIASTTLAYHFGRETQIDKRISREDYVKDLDEAKGHLTGPGGAVAVAGGLVGGMSLGGIAAHALAATPKPVQMIGVLTAMIGGTIGTIAGISELQTAAVPD